MSHPLSNTGRTGWLPAALFALFTKRMVPRVPHYKSGSELAQAVAAAKAQKP